MNACAMIARCFRHQHPEAYGREPIPDEFVPSGGVEPMPYTPVVPVEHTGAIEGHRPLEEPSGF